MCTCTLVASAGSAASAPPGESRPSHALAASDARSSARTRKATSLLAMGLRIGSPLYATSRHVPRRRPCVSLNTALTQGYITLLRAGVFVYGGREQIRL